METLPVKGYTPQTPERVGLVNQNKVTEEQLLRQLDAMGGSPAFDKRWLAIARTHFEEGFMALNRSIFQPQRFALDGDQPALPLGEGLSSVAAKGEVTLAAEGS